MAEKWKKYENRYTVQISDGESVMHTTSTKALSFDELISQLEKRLSEARRWRDLVKERES